MTAIQSEKQLPTIRVNSKPNIRFIGGFPHGKINTQRSDPKAK